MTPSGQMTFCKPLRKRPPSRIPLFASHLSQATEASPFDKLSPLSSVEGRDTLHARGGLSPRPATPVPHP